MMRRKKKERGLLKNDKKKHVWEAIDGNIDVPPPKDTRVEIFMGTDAIAGIRLAKDGDASERYSSGLCNYTL